MNNENNNIGNQTPYNNQNINTNQNGLNNNSNQMQMENKLIEQANICPNCNAVFPLEYNSCPECGSTNLEKLYTSTILQEIKKNEKNQQTNNKKGDNKIFIIVGIIIFAIILAIILSVIFENKSDNISKNEYENDETNSNVTSNYNKCEYNGFEFEKIPGYSYEFVEEFLDIYNNSYYISMSISEYNFDQIKTKAVEVSNELSSRGYTTSNAKLQTVSGIELVTCEISVNGVSGIYFMTSAPTNNSYTFEGVVMNSSYVVNNDDLTEVVKLISNSKYVGDYIFYSKNFSFNYDLDNMIKWKR